LPSGAARALDALIEAQHDALDREEFADRIGLAATGGTFSTAIGNLRRYALVEASGRGFRRRGQPRARQTRVLREALIAYAG
jgi:hypothetical protein